jgi:hypothetical protein
MFRLLPYERCMPWILPEGCTLFLTNCMESSTWEAASRLATKKFSIIVEHEGLLSFSQQPVTGTYPEPDESSPHPLPISLRSSHIRIWLLSTLFPSGFPTKNSVYILLLCYSCCMPCDLILLYLIVSIIFYEEYKVWSSSLCSFFPASSLVQIFF